MGGGNRLRPDGRQSSVPTLGEDGNLEYGPEQVEAIWAVDVPTTPLTTKVLGIAINFPDTASDTTSERDSSRGMDIPTFPPGSDICDKFAEKPLLAASSTSAMEVVSTPMGFFDSSLRTTTKFVAVGMLVLAMAAIFVGVQLAPKLMAAQRYVTYLAPPGSPSLAAEDRLKKYFPLVGKASQGQVVLLICAKDGQPTVLTDSVEAFMKNVSRSVHVDNRTAMMAPAVTGYFVGAMQVGIPPKDPILMAGFVSKDERMALIDFFATKPGDPKLVDWQIREEIISFMKDFMMHPPEGTEVFLTGNPAISHDAAVDHSIVDMERAELYILPIALVVMASLIRDLRLLILPPIVLLVTFLTATAAVLPVTWIMPNFSSDIPPAMVSVVLAFSLDYSLFLLTRFNENIALKMSLQENIDVLISQTAHTIAVSGLLVAVAFFGALSIPEANLQTAGVCLGVTTLVSFLVNTTLTPAMLVVFGRFFTMNTPYIDFVKEQLYVLSSVNIMRKMTRIVARHGSTCSGSTSGPEAELRASKEQQQAMGSWFLFMRCIERCPLAAIVAVFAIFMPLLVNLPSIRTSADSYAMLPNTMPSIVALRALDAAGFPAGRFEPYTIVITTDETPPNKTTEVLHLPTGQRNPLMTSSGFDRMLDLCDRVRKVGGVSALLGPPWVIDQRLDFASAQRLNNGPFYKKHSRIYRVLMMTHAVRDAALIQVHTSFLPRGPGAADWVLHMRNVLSAWEAKHLGYRATLSGGAGLETDIREIVMQSIPRYIGVSLAGVMLMVFGMFRSLVLPIRLGFALIFTLMATFGVAVVVYQTPLLHGIYPWLADFDGLTYESVPIATCIAVALGLDYDIFLISRIFEFRKRGMSDRDAIVYGVARTGGIISGAGVIMALAFSGLMFSPKLMHQQFSLLLVTSVLLDTFVVRTVLVPALMLSADGWNWWPYEMPEPSIDCSEHLFEPVARSEDIRVACVVRVGNDGV